jgi:flagellar protein FlgJ
MLTPLNPTPASNSASDAKLKKACQDFESIFTAKLLKGMRDTVQTTDLYGSEKDESTFRDMFDEEVAKRASGGNGNGIAEMLYRQLSHLNKAPASEISLKTGASSVEK